MKTPEQIRNMEFQKSTMGGYKQSDVELFLEEVASEIEMLIRQKADADRKLQEYSQKAPEGTLSAAGIQNILINAQCTADKIIDDAKEEAGKINAEAQLEIKQAEIKAKEMIAEAETKALLLGDTAEKEAAKIIAEAVAKSEEVVVAAKESVELEQKLYDRLMIEVSDFRKKAAAQCASVLELINQLPAEIPFNMERAKTVLAMDFNDPKELLKKAVDEKLAKEKAVEDAVLAEQKAAEDAKVAEEAEAARIAAEQKAAEEAARIAEEEAAKKAAEEAEAARVAAEKKAAEEKTEKAQLEEIKSVSDEAPKKESVVAFDDNVIPVQAAPVEAKAPEVNMQLSFDDEQEDTEKKKNDFIIGKAQPAKQAKGRISFGVDEDDEEDEDDDEPRLFFKKKKK